MRNIFLKRIILFLIFGFIFCFSKLTFADDFLKIEATVDVLKTCQVYDTDGTSHLYGETNDLYLGICALQSLLEEEHVSSIGLSNQYPDMGLFVISFNEILADPSSQYWSLYHNDSYASSGISTLEIIKDDIISFKLSDFSGTETGDYVNIKVGSLIGNDEESKETEDNQEQNPEEEENFEEENEKKEENSDTFSGGGGGSSVVLKIEKTFSLSKAFDFLISKQKEDGSYGYSFYTDWVAISASAGNNLNLKSSLSNHLKQKPINSDLLTDYQRRAMALMSLGIDPYSGTEINYLKKIVDKFDGFQLGERDLVNDDIFGLIVLQNAGYNKDDEIIKQIISYLISKQSTNGSWGSVDLTGAAIMALNDFKQITEVSSAISNGYNYLIGEKKNDGSFGNVFSTSWAIQALSLNNLYKNEVKNGIQYLANNQKEDGGLDEGNIESRIWATAYAIPAVLELSWNDILKNFDKLEIEKNEDDNLGNLDILTENQDNKFDLNDEIIETGQKNLILEKDTFTPRRIYTMDDFLTPESLVEIDKKVENVLALNDQEIRNSVNKEKNLLVANVGALGNIFSRNQKIIFVFLLLVMIFGVFVLKRKF